MSEHDVTCSVKPSTAQVAGRRCFLWGGAWKY